MVDDITSDVNTDDKLVEELKVQQHKQTVERTVEKNPLMNVESGLNEQLVEMTKRGVTSALFGGVERCISVIDKGSANQRHCMAMMVTDSARGKVCTRCNKQPNPGVCNPKVINSSMIRLNDKELKECGLDKDPTYIPPEKRGTEPKITLEPKKDYVVRVKRQYTRRIKVAVPNTVKIELSMNELDTSEDLVKLLLEKTIAAIYELPITKFSEAEAIRSTSEKIKGLLKGEL
jgi:hypothetical protein